MKLSFGIIWGVSFTFFPIILSKSKDVVLVNQMSANVEVRNTTFQHEICGKDWESDVFVELAWCFLDSSIQGSLNYSYWVGIKQCRCMVMLRDSLLMVHVLKLVTEWSLQFLSLSISDVISNIPFNPVHPWRLTWNIIMEVWKIIFLSKWVLCRFHVNLPGCIHPYEEQHNLQLWNMILQMPLWHD